MDSKKICGFQFFSNLNSFIWLDFQNVHIICIISNFWTQKMKMQLTKTLAKTFCIYNKRMPKIFAIPPLLKLGIAKIGKFWTPRIQKIPQPEYRSVFEMNKYQEMGVKS